MTILQFSIELFGANHQRNSPRVYAPAELVNAERIYGSLCLACGDEIERTHEIACLMLGPGEDVDAQKRYVDGMTYYARAIAGHRSCFDPSIESDDDDARELVNA